MNRASAQGHPNVHPIDRLLDNAKLAERHGQWAEARQQYEQLLETPQSVPGGRSALLRWIGRTHLQEGRPDVAMGSFVSALMVAEERGDVASMAHATNWLAITEQQMGNLDRSEELYAQARAQAMQAGDDMLLAMIDQNLGTIANIRGSLTVALRCYESSLSRYRAIGVVEYQAHVLNNMGLLYTDLGDWAEAESAYAQACDACDVVDNLVQRRRIEVNQVELLIARQELAQARERCEAMLADVPKDREAQRADAPWLGEMYKHYGIVCRELGEFPKADEFLAHAARMAVETWDLLLGAETAREQADLYRRQQRHADTLRALHQAHNWFTQLKAQRDLTVIERRNQRLERQFLEVVQRWGDSIEGKDQYTQGHCERVADVACELAARVGFDPKMMFWFRIGALLHDVGKLIVPSEVLNKPGKLTDEEWVLMRRHPEAGVELLADIDFPWDVRPMIRNHHERWDGRGYPDQLTGEAIPLEARILCIADVYDALTSSRAYRVGLSHECTVELMSSESGHFDPELFKVFLAWAAERTEQQHAA